MSSEVVTIDLEKPANAAWSLMRLNRIRHLVVKDGARLVGMVSERDLGGREGAEVRKGKRVCDLMIKGVVTAKPTTTLRRAANLMSGRMIGSLPVMDGDRVVGIVTATDVLEELGRGSTRPAVRAQRRSMRMPPASARQAVAKHRKTATTAPLRRPPLR